MDPTKQLREDAAACDFVATLLQDRELGKARTLAEYQACFPEFADRIATEHAALQASATTPPTPASIAGRDVGPYRFIERLGHGGQGVVFLAEHRDLQRTVALKMLHQGGLGLDSTQHARLRREAMTLARLDHPGICSIYEVELDGPHPYLAMRYVPGASLAATIEQSRKSGGKDGLPPRTRAELDIWLSFFERAAQALHAAHRVGIVHRDVKPHNLMRTPSGEPVLLDFGLARDTTSPAVVLTQSHELFGTLSYMAPELLAGAADPDPRADVYALGVTLYEALTLQRPFAAATPDALRRQIESGEITQAHAHNPQLPRNVDVVLATALERDPARRYASALALAEDLRRLRQREPILARPLGSAVKAHRWVRRHPLFSVAFALLATGLAVTLALLSAVEQSNAELRASNGELSAVRQAHQARALSEMSPGAALADAVAAARDGKSPEIKDILLQVLDRCYEERSIRQWPELLVPFAKPAVDTQGRWVAVPFQSGTVRVYAVADGTLVGATPTDQPGHTLAAFRPGIAQLLTAGKDGVLRRWSVGPEGIQPERQLLQGEGVRRPTSELAVSADGRLAARCDNAGTVEIFDLSRDTAVVVCNGHGHGVALAAFDPAGKRLLTLSSQWGLDLEGDDTVRVFDVENGHQLACIGPVPGRTPRHAAWSPDGSLVAIAHDEGRVAVFASGDGRPVWHFDHGGQAGWVEFDPKRARLLSGSSEGLDVRNRETGVLIQRDSDFGDRAVTQVTFHGDGQRFAVLANDGSVRIYDADTLRPQRTLRSLRRPTAVCWAAAGERLLTLQAQSLVTWFAGERPFLPSLEGHTDRVVKVSFDAAGTRVLSASRDRTVRLWGAERGELRAVLPHAHALLGARFAARGDRVVSTCEAGTAWLWSLDPPRALPLGQEHALDAWFFDDDREILTTDGDGWLRIYDAGTGALRAEHRGHDSKIECAAWFAPRGWIATGAGGRVVSVFDCNRREEVFRSTPWPWPHSPGNGRRVFGITFTPDGKGVIAAGQDQRLHRFALTVDQPSWRSAEGPTYGFLVCPDGGRELLAAGLFSPAVAAFDPVTGMWVGPAPVTAHNAVTSLRVDASGRRVLCADKGGRVSVFELSPARLLIVIRASTQPLLDAEFSPDGASIVTADMTGRIRIWPVDPLPIAERQLRTLTGHATAR